MLSNYVNRSYCRNWKYSNTILIENIIFKVPAFETTDGKYITESNAIAYYGKIEETLF